MSNEWQAFFGSIFIISFTVCLTASTDSNLVLDYVPWLTSAIIQWSLTLGVITIENPLLVSPKIEAASLVLVHFTRSLIFWHSIYAHYGVVFGFSSIFSLGDCACYCASIDVWIAEKLVPCHSFLFLKVESVLKGSRFDLVDTMRRKEERWRQWTWVENQWKIII